MYYVLLTEVSFMSLLIISTAELFFLFNNSATPPYFLCLSFRFFVKILKPGISMECISSCLVYVSNTMSYPMIKSLKSGNLNLLFSPHTFNNLKDYLETVLRRRHDSLMMIPYHRAPGTDANPC